MEPNSSEQTSDLSKKSHNVGPGPTATQTNYGVLSLISNISRSLKILKMRTLEAEASTQAVTSLLDDASVARNDMTRKNEIAQSGLNEGLMEIVKHTYSTFEILRPIESEYAIQEETRRLLESEAKVEALRKSAIEERLRHEEERARCREYQRLYCILHEQMGELNARIEGLKAQLSVVQSEVELSKTKLKEAAEKSFFQKDSMEALQLRLQDDRKAFSAQFRRMVEQENALMDERRRHESCQQILIKIKLSEKQALKLQKQAEDEKNAMKDALAEERGKSQQLLEQCDKLSALCSLMEAEQTRRHQLQVQSTTSMELDFDVQMENEETSCNSTAIPSTAAECSNLQRQDSKAQDFEKDDSDMMADKGYLAESVGIAVTEENNDIRTEVDNFNIGEPAISANDIGFQESKQEKICLSSEKNQGLSESIQLEKNEAAISDLNVPLSDIVQDENSEVDGFTCPTADENADAEIIKRQDSCDSAKFDLDTTCQHNSPFAAHNTIDDEETQCETLGNNEIEEETLSEEDIAKNEVESEKVLLEASKKCVNDFVQMSRTAQDSGETLDERKIEDINSSVINAQWNPAQGIPDLSNDTQRESQEKCTGALTDEIIQEMDYECNSMEPAFGPSDYDLPTEAVAQNINCNVQAEEI